MSIKSGRGGVVASVSLVNVGALWCSFRSSCVCVELSVALWASEYCGAIVVVFGEVAEKCRLQ